MPCHDFSCKKCHTEFEDFCPKHDQSGVYLDVKCPGCGSNDHKLIPSVFGFAFSNPIGTSKMDNFEYAAGHNLDKAKAIRRQGEASNHMGPNVHPDIHDLDRSGVFGEVQ